MEVVSHFLPEKKEARDLEPWPQKEGFGTTRSVQIPSDKKGFIFLD